MGYWELFGCVWYKAKNSFSNNFSSLQQDVSFSTKTIFVVLNTVQTSKTPTFFCCQRSLMNCPVFRYNLHRTLKSKVKSYECDIQRRGCRGRLWVYLDGKFEIRNEHNHVPDHDKSKLVKVSALSIFLGASSITMLLYCVIQTFFDNFNFWNSLGSHHKKSTFSKLNIM